MAALYMQEWVPEVKIYSAGGSSRDKLQLLGTCAEIAASDKKRGVIKLLPLNLQDKSVHREILMK